MELAVLHHEEGVRLDPDCLWALISELGETGAEEVICKAMEELSVRLADIRRQAEHGQTLALIRSARLSRKIAEQIGMASLARVAGDVAATAAAGDHIGLAATLARLDRIGDRSLHAIWEINDMTI